MKKSLTLKEALLSALYFICAVIIIFIVDIGLYYFLNEVLFKVFNWFNKLAFVWKIIIIIFGGLAIFVSLVKIVSGLTTFLGGLIFNKLPQNLFTILTSIGMALANAIYFSFRAWKVPVGFNFWVVVELLFVTGLIFSLCFVIMPTKYQSSKNSN